MMQLWLWLVKTCRVLRKWITSCNVYQPKQCCALHIIESCQHGYSRFKCKNTEQNNLDNWRLCVLLLACGPFAVRAAYVAALPCLAQQWYNGGYYMTIQTYELYFCTTSDNFKVVYANNTEYNSEQGSTQTSGCNCCFWKRYFTSFWYVNILQSELGLYRWTF